MKGSQNNSNAVTDLIRHIKVMYYNNDPMLDSVNDVNMLYNSLCDLNEIIGMPDVKDSIVKQIKFLLYNYSCDKKKFENHMLHTIVFGPPGVGKTTIGTCLANIWKSLGLVSKKKINTKQMFDKYIHKCNTSDSTNSHIKKSEQNEDISNEYQDDGLNNNIIADDLRKSLIYLTLKHELLIDDLTNKSCDMRQYIDDIHEFRKNSRRLDLLTVGIKNLMKNSGTIEKPRLERIKISPYINIISRPDLVGQYVGNTCAKTRKLLEKTLKDGKVLFIDEAYSIVIDEKDSFGHEALNEINRFMSENPELIVIFAGYKDKMEDTLFKYQPGFKRRCTWVFEISKYTGEMLASIFLKQLNKENWSYEGEKKYLIKFFDEKLKHFDAFGGDTIRLVLYCKLKYSELKFEYNPNFNIKDKVITYDIFKTAYIDMYCKNKPENIENISLSQMYI